MRILVVEDDELIAESLVKCLTQVYYAVDLANDGETGYEFAESCAYDLIVLDVILPKLDGIDLCRNLRSKGIKSPILLLTARDSATNKVAGLDAGADDYLTKPVDLQEFLARIRALLRRGSLIASPLLEWENLRLDPSLCQVTYNNQPLHLTPKEYGLLELFLRNPHRIFNCGAIIDHLWSFEEPPTDDTVRAHLKGMRRKLGNAGVPEIIETIYGIGYRLKNTSTGENQKKEKKKKETKQAITDSPSSQAPALKEQTQQITNKVWERSQEKLSKRVGVVEQAVKAILQDTLDKELMATAYQEAHKLAGSLGMFGFEFGSRLAKDIEELLEVGESLNSEQKLRLSELVLGLRQQLQQSITSTYPDNLLNYDASVDEQPLVLIVDRDKLLVEEIVKLAKVRGIRCQSVENTTIAREEIYYNNPELVILNIAGDDEQDLQFLLQLNLSTPPIPVLVLASRGSVTDRVKITRFGGRGFLQKPVAPTQVIEAAINLLEHSRNAMAKVLLVDDDPEILSTLSNLLKPWGIKAYTLDNPLNFWDFLEKTAPDLLVLDVEMPQLSGIELCQVIRNDQLWSGLPVLFLTAHKDGDTMRRVFAAGADDFVSKPIFGPELVTRILNRLERFRWLRNMAEIDPLTGVSNRRKSIEEFQLFLRSVEESLEPLCLVVLKINYLQQINHIYGHGVGDEVLCRIGRLCKRFFPNDIISRWGGAEFLIGMYNMKLADGVHRVQEFIKIIYTEKISVPNGDSFQLNISWGVAEYPQDGIDLQALYQAAISGFSQKKQ